MKLITPILPTDPLWDLAWSLPASLRGAAPERSSELSLHTPNLSIEIHQNYDFRLNVNVSDEHINVSRAVLEFIWASSYAYLKIYSVLTSNTSAEGQIISLDEFPQLNDSRELLVWGLENLINQKGTSWPKHLPNPDSDGDDMTAASTEVALMAMGFLLHHELAHIRLGHTGASELASEKEADLDAFNWVFSQVRGGDERLVNKRILGIAIAMYFVACRGVYTGQFGGTSHPRSFDRLFNILVEADLDPNNLVWCMTAMVLKLHLQNAHISVTEQPQSTFKAAVNEYVELLANLAEQK